MVRVPWSLVPSSLMAGTVTPGNPIALSATWCSPGIRSIRRYSMPLWRSISSAVSVGCEAAMPNRVARMARIFTGFLMLVCNTCLRASI